jgi:hypothetical protein
MKNKETATSKSKRAFRGVNVIAYYNREVFYRNRLFFA